MKNDGGGAELAGNLNWRNAIATTPRWPAGPHGTGRCDLGLRVHGGAKFYTMTGGDRRMSRVPQGAEEKVGQATGNRESSQKSMRDP